MRFDAIYLDTEVLYRNGWPSRSIELRILIELSRMLSLAVLVPEAVEMERQRQWINDVEEEFRALSKAHKAVSKSCNRWNLPEPLLSNPPDRSFLEDHFLSLSNGLKKDWGIQSAAIAEIPLRNLYEMAIHGRGAFEDGKGGLVGLQDTVIFLSVLQHIKGLNGARGVFVSGDHVFQTQEIK